MAFDGLCPWKSVNRVKLVNWGRDARSAAMRKRAMELWSQADTCLVLPGDGGYERRLYSILNMGCIPVIVTASGVSFPKIPFAKSIPWHEFAIIWSLDPTKLMVVGDDLVDYKEGLTRSAVQLLQQLLSLSPEVIWRKREALFRYA